MKPIFVIGHKNPDIDSIAAAIAYKTYKQSTDDGLYIAATAGEISEEGQYVLEYLDFDPPKVIKDVGTRVDDLLDEENLLYVTIDMTLTELGNLMRNRNLKTVPVLDDQKKFLGLVTIGDIATMFMNELGTGHDLEKTPEILRKILGCRVDDLMKTRDLVLFEKDEPVEEARQMMLSTRFRNYPVVDEQNHYLGMISRYNLLQRKRKQLILVDHNEKKQAVDGVEEAEILEIIDHHRVGDMQTISPIFFHNEPVGSTCTLIAQRFLENRIYFSEKLAALMMAGIVSDTMLFKSPTTTAKDKRIAEQLKEICGFEPVEWGKQILENTGLPEKMSDREIIGSDLKEYVSGKTTFAVSQLETVNMERFSERKQSVIQTMKEICAGRHYDFMCLMVTDIMEEGTELIITGENSSMIQSAFQQQATENTIFLKGVMSRKKQVIPVIYEALRKQNIM